LSQRTQGRTTGAASRSQPEPSAAGPNAAPRAARRPRRPSAPKDAPAVDPEVIARTLRAVADELERDPALAGRVAAGMERPLADLAPRASEVPAPVPAAERGGRRFQARLVTGVDAALGPGILDPFALRRQLGAEGLAAALAELRLGGLRAIIREHGLDPRSRTAHVNDADRLRAVILEASAERER
jgi:hypothetical protein